MEILSRIIRSNRKTVSMTIRGGELTVRAPFGMKDEEIEAFLKRHRRWIQKHTAPQRTLDFSFGASLSLYGIQYEIREGKAGIEDNILYLPATKREEAVKKLLRQIALKYMTDLTEKISRRYGFSYRSVRIGSARTRWGSCSSKGEIIYTFRTVFLSPEEALYLAVHELCHTRHMNHSSAFWKEVERILPQYREERGRLKAHAWVMSCL